MKNIEILLVDDDSDDRGFFGEALALSGIPAVLTTCNNGRELADYLAGVTRPRYPDVIFLDINMPGRNGQRCLEDLRKEKKFDGIPIVMFSVSSYIVDIDEAYKRGANKYILKEGFFEDEIKILKELFATPAWKQSLTNTSREVFFQGRSSGKSINQLED